MEKYNVKELFNNSLQLIANYSGIYMFINNINNKCYIGQAINIRKRLAAHRYNYTKNKLTNPLYKAFSKYGIENFTYTILECGLFSKEELDSLEINYIEKYNSYNTGYNQTLGADGGILGYKFTPEQLDAVREHRNNYIEQSKVYQIHIYDIFSKKLYTFSSPTKADEYFKWKTAHCAIRYNLTKSKYIIYRNIEDYYKKLESLDTHKGKFQVKISKEDFLKFISENTNLSRTELIKKLGVCKKTFYNYFHKYIGEVPSKTKKKHNV